MKFRGVVEHIPSDMGAEGMPVRIVVTSDSGTLTYETTTGQYGVFIIDIEDDLISGKVRVNLETPAITKDKQHEYLVGIFQDD